jgi:hypothetical protein
VTLPLAPQKIEVHIRVVVNDLDDAVVTWKTWLETLHEDLKGLLKDCLSAISGTSIPFYNADAVWSICSVCATIMTIENSPRRSGRTFRWSPPNLS